jgi:uncharacterized protein (DUF1800 family)
MASGKQALNEKMVLFWHDHFPSSYDVVGNLRDLAQQNATFREYGMGSFRDLLHQVTRDPAMLDFLDGKRNHVDSPNENYARELMELFTLGPQDRNGVDTYSQNDVVELARSLTGFRCDQKKKRGGVAVAEWAFDSGDKTLFEGRPFEVSGNLGVEHPDGTPFPPNRNVIDLLFTHRDSDDRPTLARFISRKLWEWFVHPDPAIAQVDEMADVFVQSGYVVRDLLYAILTHDTFYSTQARESTAKTPVDFALQSLLAVGARSNMKEMPGALESMGMELFNPPGVEGWNHGEPWLATGRYLARFHFAQDLAGGGERKRKGKKRKRVYRFKPEKLLGRSVQTSEQIVDKLLGRFQVAVPSLTRQALIDFANGGAPAPGSAEWAETRLRDLLVLMLSLPEFQAH